MKPVVSHALRLGPKANEFGRMTLIIVDRMLFIDPKFRATHLLLKPLFLKGWSSTTLRVVRLKTTGIRAMSCDNTLGYFYYVSSPIWVSNVISLLFIHDLKRLVRIKVNVDV